METKRPDRSESNGVSYRLRLAAAVLATACLAAACAARRSDAPRAGAALPAALVARNLAAPAIAPPAVLDSLLAAERGLPRARRIGLWARRFLAAPEASYLFGLKPGGYAAEGLLVEDTKLDCVSLMYRCTELARAEDGRDALAVALATRFAGADAAAVADDAGRLDYDHPAHLDYSLDMIRSGHWGRDVTPTLTGARPDARGTSRYPPGAAVFVPESDLREEELREGDIVWLRLSPDHAAAVRLRDEYGLLIGHLGLIVIEEGRPWLIHAASSGLAGWYDGGRVAAAPLAVYLERVERYDGVLVTRCD